MNYKVIYYQGDSVDSSTEMKSGLSILTDTELPILGDETISITLSNLIGIALFRLHGLGRMLRISHRDGTLFLSVIRFRLIRLPLIGQFATINFLKTGQLLTLLQSKIQNATTLEQVESEPVELDSSSDELKS